MEKVNVPDPIVAQPKQKKMTFKRKTFIIFFVGFLAGWLWMSWGMYLDQPVGLAGIAFWRMVLPW